MKLFRTLAVLLLLVSAAFAAQTNYGKFSIDSPVTMKSTGETNGKTDHGDPYTQENFIGTLPNSDIYMASVATYQFQITAEALQDGLTGFTKGSGTRVLSVRSINIEDRPALAAILSGTVEGREVRFALVVTGKGNTLYLLVFGSYMDTKDTDNNAVARYFSSFESN